MISIKAYPSNKEHFVKLKSLLQEILAICKEVKVTPIVYGSLAFFGYTQDKKTAVNDIDLLVPESSFVGIIRILKKRKMKYRHSVKWHTLQVFHKYGKIELDAIEFWQKDLSHDVEDFDFDGLMVKVVSLKTLRNIYKKASEVSKDNPRGNLKKFETLRKLN